MSDNNELLKNIPTPGKVGAASTNTGNVPKVQADDDDTRTRKTVKLSMAGLAPQAGGKVSPENLATSRPVPPPTPSEMPGAAPSHLRPATPGAITPKIPGATPAAAPAAAVSTDTGSVPKQAADDTRTRRTVRISAAAVEDTVKIQRAEAAAAPAPAPTAKPSIPAPSADASAVAKPKLSIPKPAAKPAAPAPAAPAPTASAAPAAAQAPTPRAPKEKASLNLKKDEEEKKAPSRVAADMAKISNKKGSGEASMLYTILAIITILALGATLAFSSQYLNVWEPGWANGFTIMPSK